MRRAGVLAVMLACSVAPGGVARADDKGRLLGDDTFATREGGELIVDAGLLVALPTALPTGLSTGFTAGLTRNCGCLFSYGVRAAWSTVNESSLVWDVTQSDLRLRAVGAIRHTAGRGTLSLRLGVGPTIVHETRDRTQSMRAGEDMHTSAWRAVPAADLELVVGLHITGPWLAIVSGGPTLDVLPDHVRGGWTAQLGFAWQP